MKLPIKHYLLTLAVISINCFGTVDSTSADLGRVVPTIQTIGKFIYSSGVSPYGLPNTTTTIFQTSGARVYCCQMPSTSNPDMICISMQLTSRYGGRFSNSPTGQVLVNMIGQHLYNLYFNKWSSIDLPAAMQSSGSSISMTTTTSGIAITIICALSDLNNAFQVFVSILLNIYSTDISSSDFTSICNASTNEYNSNITSMSFTNKQFTSTSFIKPKWDCTHTFADSNFGGLFTSGPGLSNATYTSTKSNIWASSSTQLSIIQSVLNTLKRDKDLTFFIASSTPTIASLIPAALQYITQVQVIQAASLGKVYYGYPGGRGAKITFSTTGAPATENSEGFILYLGPLSQDTLLAAQLALYLVRTGTITSTSYTGTYGSTLWAALIPTSGQSTFRVSSHVFASATTADTVMQVFLSALQSRYCGSNNISDFTQSTVLSEITKLYNHLIPATTHNNNDKSNVDSVLTLNAQGYVNWMYLFQGAFKAINDLNSLTAASATVQYMALARAANILINKSFKSECTEIVYYKS